MNVKVEHARLGETPTGRFILPSGKEVVMYPVKFKYLEGINLKDIGSIHTTAELLSRLVTIDDLIMSPSDILEMDVRDVAAIMNAMKF